MPRLIDQRTGQYLCTMSDQERAQFMALLEDTNRDEQEPLLVDPDVVERLENTGVSRQVLVVLQQFLEGREDFAIGWEPDRSP